MQMDQKTDEISNRELHTRRQGEEMSTRPTQWSKGVSITTTSDDDSDSEPVQTKPAIPSVTNKEWGYALNVDSSDDDEEVEKNGDSSGAATLSKYRWGRNVLESSSSDDDTDTDELEDRKASSANLTSSEVISCHFDSNAIAVVEIEPEEILEGPVEPESALCEEDNETLTMCIPHPLPNIPNTCVSNLGISAEGNHRVEKGVEERATFDIGESEICVSVPVYQSGAIIPAPPLQSTAVGEKADDENELSLRRESVLRIDINTADGISEGDVQLGVIGSSGARGQDERGKKKKKNKKKRKKKPSDTSADTAKNIILAALDAEDIIRKSLTGRDPGCNITDMDDYEGQRDGSTAPAVTATESPLFSSQKFSYGHADSQYFVLHIPRETPSGAARDTNAVPLVVIIHGGFWKAKYGIENSAIDSLPGFLLSQGMAVCLLEYRRITAESPDDEGGYPATNDDILQALRQVHAVIAERQHAIAAETNSTPVEVPTEADPLVKVDMNRVVLIGHSAGGYLALWTCCHLSSRFLPFTPALCVAIAPVCDLDEACRRRLSDEGDAVEKFIKYPFDTSNPVSMATYSEACPSKLLPLEVPTIIAIGTSDADIPADMVENFYCNAKAVARQQHARIPIELVMIEDANHYDVVNAATPAWERIFDEITAMIALSIGGIVLESSPSPEALVPKYAADCVLPPDAVDFDPAVISFSAAASSCHEESLLSHVDAAVLDLTTSPESNRSVPAAETVECSQGSGVKDFTFDVPCSPADLVRFTTVECPLIPLDPLQSPTPEKATDNYLVDANECNVGNLVAGGRIDEVRSCVKAGAAVPQQGVGGSNADTDTRVSTDSILPSEKACFSSKQWGRTVNMDSSSDEDCDGGLWTSPVHRGPMLAPSEATKVWGYALDTKDDSSDDDNEAVSSTVDSEKWAKENSDPICWCKVDVGSSSSDSEDEC